MKKLILLIAVGLGIVMQAQAIDASIIPSLFKSPTKSYVELHLQVVGTTVHYKTIEGYPQGGVEVLVLFKRGEEILKYDKYILNTPKRELQDTSFIPHNFSNLKRYALEDGEYRLEVKLKDINKEENVKAFDQAIMVGFEEDEVGVSDLQLVEEFRKAGVEEVSNFVKNGYHIEPHPFGFYSRYYDKLKFYAEIYNAKKVLKDDFFVRYYIEEAVNEPTPLQMSYKRMKQEPINVLILQLDISKIPSGNYNVVLEVRNRENKLIKTQKAYFQRSNPYLELEVTNYQEQSFENTFTATLDDRQVQYSLRAIMPIADGLEVRELNNIIKSDDVNLKRNFLFGYWASKHPNKTKEAFMTYMKKASAVDKKFASTLGYGFETDRGRVYLKYGAPNDIIQELSEPTAPPYEIWEYNSLNLQQNVKFVFSNRSLVANDYNLIHSTLRGELSDPQWQRKLYKNAPVQGGNFLDRTTSPAGIGNNAGRRFNN